MGIHDILRHLPGGNTYHYSFYSSGLLKNQSIVPIDIAGALWTYANKHQHDYLKGNYNPALSDLTKLLNNLRSLCGLSIKVFFDGRANHHKRFEDQRRESNLIRNTPEYIARAAQICRFLGIEFVVSAYEADSQVTHYALHNRLVPITGDSDLLAIGSSEKPGEDDENCDVLRQLVVVNKWQSESYRVIDLDAPHTNGNLPLYDLYLLHGRIIFQLYAACSGCDFTEQDSGITGIGFKTFIKLVEMVDGELTASKLAAIIWRENQKQVVDVGLTSEEKVREHLVRITAIYSRPLVYDADANIVDFTGMLIEGTSPQHKLHMAGKANTRSTEPFNEELHTSIMCMDVSQLLHHSAADASTIRGVNLPLSVAAEQCDVPTLRDHIAARGGKISGKKADLVKASKSYIFLESQVSRSYINRQVDKEGSLYVSLNTSGTRSIGVIMAELKSKFETVKDAPATKSLIDETCLLMQRGLFDSNYDNIARIAPELKEGLIYKTFGHIGSSRNEKNTGDALARCLYTKEATFHAIAFVPDTDRCIILSKAIASMKTDEKTRNQTDDGEMCKRAEYPVILELRYEATSHLDCTHNLGVFVEVLRSYCAQCVAGAGLCRHKAERLWFQYHHWTDERHGIDMPSTIKACAWASGGKALTSDVRAKIYQQQTVKFERTIDAQEEKMKRGAKRDCTEGQSSDYSYYWTAEKRQYNPQQFTAERTAILYKLIEAQGDGEKQLDGDEDQY